MGRIKPSLIRNVVYPVHGLLSGRPILRCAEELERTQWLSRKELEEMQWSKLTAVLRKAQQDVPYYENLFRGQGIDARKVESPEDLKKIPVLLKRHIRNHQRELISRQCKAGELKKTSTSGSTGENIHFYQDKQCRANFLGNMLRQRKWIGVNVGELEVMIWGSAFDLGAAEKLSGRLKSYFANVAYISAYGLSTDALGSHVDFLRKTKPPLITGYASALVVFADYMLENGVRDIRPKGVITSAEMLYSPQRERIEKAFGCKVFDRYGSREFATIAHECECGNRHITMERVYLEVASEEDRPWGVEPGELIITDLDNNGMPMIRYNIGDVGVMEDEEKACPCGRGLALLREVTGRTFDMVRTPSGKMFPGTFWTILSKTVSGVTQLQVVQKKIDEIEMKIRTDSGFRPDGLRILEEIIQDHCGPEMKVHVQVVDAIPLGRTGKFQWVVSEIAPTTGTGNPPPAP